MSNRIRKPGRSLLGLISTALAAGLLAACSSSNQSAVDNAPVDIRGQPINTPSPGASATLADGTAPSTNSLKPENTLSDKLSSTPAGLIGKAEAGTASEKAPSSGTAVEFLPVAFDKLACFTFEIPDDRPSTNQVTHPAKSEEQIPAGVKALDQTKVALKGFMLPLRVEAGLVTEMLIMRDQSMCCYGTVPKINEWVSVKMTNKGVKPIMDQPVTIFGKLRVGEMRENGYLVGIYALDGAKMAAPPDL